jgi:nickel/cobalt transporter (NicO) family protein
MTNELTVLLFSAASIAFVHTVLGPDHYLPFIVMARAGKWSATKTTLITVLCGLGHVGSSVVLGFLGIGLGVAITRIGGVEELRGNIAGWLLIAFGIGYTVWGVRRAIRNRPHHHLHVHADGNVHLHEHTHQKEHLHVHQTEKSPSMTPWILFTIFVFGPCEPLIPLLMYPAAQGHTMQVVAVTCVFGMITISTMLLLVLATARGLSLLPLGHLERYSHALAGVAILFCGAAVQFLGL